MSKNSIWLLPFVLVMLLGLAPELSEYRAINPITSFRRGGVLRLLVVVLLAGAPLVVLALGLLRLTRWRMRSTPATLWIFGILSYGIVASIVLASAAGLGSANAIVHGFALTFAVTGMVAFMVQAPDALLGGQSVTCHAHAGHRGCALFARRGSVVHLANCLTGRGSALLSSRRAAQ
jgi:hypothetical protein